MPVAPDASLGPIPWVAPFLHAERSAGARERRGGAFVSFDQHDLDVRFWTALLTSNRFVAEHVCVPDVLACVHHARRRTTIAAADEGARSCGDAASLLFGVRAGVVGVHVDDRKRRRLLAPPGLDAAVAACAPVPFAVCNFGIYPGSPLDVGHANALLFHHEQRTIERYDPHGAPNGYEQRDRRIKRLFRARFPDWGYASVAPGVLGPQVRADAHGGLCATYAVLLVLVRVRHAAYAVEDVYASLDALPADVLLDVVLRLNRTCVETLRAQRGRSADDGADARFALPAAVAALRGRDRRAARRRFAAALGKLPLVVRGAAPRATPRRVIPADVLLEETLPWLLRRYGRRAAALLLPVTSRRLRRVRDAPRVQWYRS